MRRFVSAMLFALAVVAAPLVSVAAPAAEAIKAPVPKVEATWAKLTLKGTYPEGPSLPGLFGEVQETFGALLARIEKAEKDEDVSGLILNIQSPTLGWSQVNTLSQAIDRLQSKGKKVLAYLDSATTMDYLVATTCDQIVVPESGMLMLIGLRAEVTFYKNLFDKLGVEADMLRVGEFKSAAEPYTRTEMSEPFRREMEEIIDDYYRQIVEGVAKGRGLDPKKVQELIDNGPHSAADAKAAGLIDLVAYEDQIRDLIKEGKPNLDLTVTDNYGKKKIDTDFSGMTGMIKMMNLLMGVEPTQRRSSTSKVAIIYANGAIMTGESTAGILGGETLGSDTLVKAIRKADSDKSVKAIVLRVNSPGGSALASDLIWRALEKVEKPFVVSMGDVAGSGGYYIAMGADRIFAEPGTLTGSIGVVGGKFGLQGLFEKVGVTTDVIARGKNSGVMSMLDGFTETERTAMQKMLNDIYKQFTEKAAAGRKMEYDKLEALARGRVYTGAMALKIGLVDELGTLEDAVQHAAELAKLDTSKPIERLVLPKPKSPLEELFGPLDPDATAKTAGAEAIRATLEQLSPELASQLQSLDAINLLANELRLTLMPFRVIVK